MNEWADRMAMEVMDGVRRMLRRFARGGRPRWKFKYTAVKWSPKSQNKVNHSPMRDPISIDGVFICTMFSFVY